MYHIVLIEDEIQLCKQIQNELESTNKYIVHIFSSIKQIRKFLHEDYFYHLALVDFELDPIKDRINGTHVINYIVKQRPNIPIFSISGYDNYTTPENRNPNVSKFIPKPFTIRNLEIEIEKTLSHKL